MEKQFHKGEVTENWEVRIRRKLRVTRSEDSSKARLGERGGSGRNRTGEEKSKKLPISHAKGGQRMDIRIIVSESWGLGEGNFAPWNVLYAPEYR